MKKGIGSLTWLIAIAGGFILTNFIMGFFAMLINSDAATRLILPIILFPVAWSFAIIWLLNSRTSQKAFLKAVLSTFLTGAITVAVFFKGGIHG